jgi:pimeloyl-ACP methyl ester carboxylesterase
MRSPTAGHLGTAVAITIVLSLTACGDDESSNQPDARSSPVPLSPSPSPATDDLDGLIDIGDGRGLYVRCTGVGSPTVILEGGDGDTSDSYAFAEESIAAETRTCVYDRANLGQSDPAPGPRGLEELVGDLDALLRAAEIPEPYVLVGTSGGGYITAGYAVTHKDMVAGMVFIDAFSPFKNPPRPIVEETAWDHPENVEQRDYLQVEKDAWDARERIGDIPVAVVSVKYANEEVAASPFASERRALRTNVQEQRGWLVLSPRAEQIVVDTGHEVEASDPELVIGVILDVVRAARA